MNNNKINNIVETMLIITVFSVSGFAREIVNEIGPKTTKILIVGGVCYFGYKYFVG